MGVVTLIGDKTQLDPEAPTSKDKFTLKKKTGDKSGSFSRLVHWQPEGVNNHRIFNGLGERIFLRNNVNAWATISNVAPVKAPGGLTHFAHHYEGMKLANGDQPMTIEQDLADVFDCVPPVAWP